MKTFFVLQVLMVCNYADLKNSEHVYSSKQTISSKQCIEEIQLDHCLQECNPLDRLLLMPDFGPLVPIVINPQPITEVNP